jgi:hypothetical protein
VVNSENDWNHWNEWNVWNLTSRSAVRYRLGREPGRPRISRLAMNGLTAYHEFRKANSYSLRVDNRDADFPFDLFGRNGFRDQTRRQRHEGL